MTSEIKLFPGPFLYIGEVKNHSDIKNHLMPYIEDSQLNENFKLYDEYSKVRTSFVDNFIKCNQDPFFEFCSNNGFLKDMVWDPLDKCLSELPYFVSFMPDHSDIKGFWFNHFEKGGNHAAHVHTGGFISGIYILHLEEENPTVFMGNDHNLTYYTFNYPTKHVTEGSVILFPSQMWHQVTEVKSKRVTISFNIKTTFTPVLTS
jgi:hypothetical protein